MLTNYDAKAVADVLGIVFVRDSTDHSGAPHDTVEVVGETLIITSERMSAQIDYEVFDQPETASTGRQVRPPSPVLIERAVEAGLPRIVLRHVAGQLAGGDKAKIAALEWGVVPRTTLDRRHTQLSPQESERTERVARLLVHARRAIGSDEEARQFMTTPHAQLDGRNPIDAAKTDLGTRRAEQILNAIEFGLAL